MGAASRLSDMMAWQSEWEERSSFPPGPQLAVCLHGATDDNLAALSEAELLEVAAAARRQASWAQSRELAAISELARRRIEEEERQTGPDGEPGLDYRVLTAREQVVAEVAAALRLTRNAAATSVELAERLTRDLPRTRACLEGGRIDLARARVIADLTDRLGEELSAEVEERVLDKAPEQTTGQLRCRVKRVVERLAPVERKERLQEAVTHRSLELFENPEGTANLALRDLDPVCASGIFNKLNAVAHAMKSDGDVRRIHQIRADLATSLLQGGELAAAARALLAEQDEPVPPTGMDRPVGPASGGPGRTGLGRLSSSVESGAAGSNPLPDGISPAVTSRQARPGPVGERPGSVDPTSPPGGALPGFGLEAQTEPVGLRASEGPDSTHSSTVQQDEGERALDQQAATVARIIERRLDQVMRHARATGRLDHLHTLISRAVDDLRDHLADRHPCHTAGGKGGKGNRDGEPPDERHGYPGYRPPPALRKLIEERHSRCISQLQSARASVRRGSYGALATGCHLPLQPQQPLSPPPPPETDTRAEIGTALAWCSGVGDTVRELAHHLAQPELSLGKCWPMQGTRDGLTCPWMDWKPPRRR